MERIVFKFSVRHDETMPTEEMARLLEPALGCTFREGEFQDIPAWETYLLGMVVRLYEWGGVDDVPIFRLHGMIESLDFAFGPDGSEVKFVDCDISPGIVDLLQARGAGQWRIPSAEDIRWEQAYGAALARHMSQAFDDDDDDDGEDPRA